MMDLDLVPQGGFQKRCDEIFDKISKYCKDHHMYLHMSGLTKTLLGVAKVSEFPTAYLDLST